MRKMLCLMIALMCCVAARAETLTLVNCEDLNQSMLYAAVAMFQEAHPGVEVELIDMQREQLRAALMAGDSGIDVVLLQQNTIQSLAEADAICDLNEVDGLRETLESWHGQQAFCINGIRVGVPAAMLANGIAVNESLLAYAPDVDWENSTWLQVFEIAQQFCSDVDGNGVADMWFLSEFWHMPMWLQQYCASFGDPLKIDFDTEEFRATAQAYKRGVQLGAIRQEEAEMSVYTARPMFDINYRPFAPVPAINGSSAPRASIYALCIARATDSYDLAAEFLKYYASDDAQHHYPGIGFAADSKLYPYYGQNDDDPTTVAWIEASKQYIDSAQYAWFDVDYYSFAGDEIRRYIDDEVTLDQLVASLTQRLRMVVWG